MSRIILDYHQEERSCEELNIGSDLIERMIASFRLNDNIFSHEIDYRILH